ncbi:hypothetical protein N2152v2_010077 [Parachlorella kessleri]
MKVRVRHAKGRPGRKPAAALRLPEELWQHILNLLGRHDRLAAAMSCKQLARASFNGLSRMAVDFRHKVLERLPPALIEVLAVYKTEPSQFPAVVTSLAADNVDLSDFKPARSARQTSDCRRALRQLVKALPSAATGAHLRPLSLNLALSGSIVVLQQLERLLQSGQGGRITKVAVARGLAALDGALQDRLVRANVLGSSLVPWLKVGAYRTLSWVSAKVDSTEELHTLLDSITQQSLPALRTLVLVAQQGGSVHGALSKLRHDGLAQLVLHGVEAEGGFEDLEHLTGLESLSLCYDEDDGPDINLEGNLHLLSSMPRLRHLRLTNLACDEGLPTLTQLTSLAVSPGSDTYIAVERLPRLQRLCVDLTAECRGLELLQPGCVVYVPRGHGLTSLTHLELRSFVWSPERNASDEPQYHLGSGDSGAAAVFSAGSNMWQQGAEDDWDSEDGWEHPQQHAQQAQQPVGWGAPDVGDASDGSEAGAEPWGGAGSMGSNSDIDSDVGDGSSSSSSSSSGGSGTSLEEVGADAEEEGGQAAGQDGGSESPSEGGTSMLGGGAAATGGSRGDAEQGQEGRGDAAYAVALPEQAQQGSSAGDVETKAASLLESRYLASLVRRIPTLTHIMLADYMGPVPGRASAAADPDAQPAGGQAEGHCATQPRVVATRSATAKAAAAARASTATTPEAALLGSGSAEATACEGGKRVHATLCDIAGTVWERCVCETPVPGGMSQIDLRYTKL